MSLLDLAALYLVVGAGCAVVVYRRNRGPIGRRLGSSAVALALWPIWAPIALIPDAPPRTPASDRAARVLDELTQAGLAAARSPFEVLLSADAVGRIASEIRLVARRITELDEVLTQPGFDLAAADRRVNDLIGVGGKRAIETAVLHRNNVARIHALRDRHARALEELGELVGALRSQLVLARYAGSSPEGVGGIVTELWSRLEGLGEVMDAHDEVEPSARREMA